MPPSLMEGVEAFERGKFKQARALFEEAAARGDTVADVYLGMLHWLGKAGFSANPEEAVKHFRRSAHAGSAVAQVNLGLAHLAGIGAPRDDAAARDWFEQAAQAQSFAAVHQLARLAAAGRGEPGDMVRARSLWEKAAEGGYPPAMRAYGAALADGHGGAAAPVEGLAWLYAAASLGADQTAAQQAKFLAARMRGSDIARGHKKGRALARRLARRAHFNEHLPHAPEAAAGL
jgi:TPR repeat protein